MKKIEIIAIGLVAILVVSAGAFKVYRFMDTTYGVASSLKETNNSAKTTKIPKKVAPPQTPVPDQVDIAMTFYPQAPFGSWKAPWQDACEEASMLLIANAYYHYNWTRGEFRDQILKIINWEKKTFGYYEDTNVKEMVQTLRDNLNLQSIVHINPSFGEVQNILAQGHLIIAPLAGRKIGNPFYTNGGPNYHVMVIKGYKTEEKIITEDVGTRRGENYIYSWKTIMDANHDYATPIENGAKVLIEVLPPSQS